MILIHVPCHVDIKFSTLHVCCQLHIIETTRSEIAQVGNSQFLLFRNLHMTDLCNFYLPRKHWRTRLQWTCHLAKAKCLKSYVWNSGWAWKNPRRRRKVSLTSLVHASNRKLRVLLTKVEDLQGLIISKRSRIEFPAMNSILSLVQLVKNLSPPSEW